MSEALKEAHKACEKKEVPVGAVLVMDGRIVGRGHNLKESGLDPTAHAEMIAIKAACAELRCWRLPHSAMFVTLEPCAMCVGAMLSARIESLYYALDEPKSGAVSSLYRIADDPRQNHRMKINKGIGAEESGRLLKWFFQELRRGARAVESDGLENR
ncbi:MAG: nucleoside deaminase [bacterium]